MAQVYLGDARRTVHVAVYVQSPKPRDSGKNHSRAVGEKARKYWVFVKMGVLRWACKAGALDQLS